MIDIKNYRVSDAINFVVSQLENVETKMYSRKYKKIVYSQLIPISNEVPNYATTHSYYAIDAVGMAKFIDDGAFDIPLVQLEGSRQSIEIYRGAIGYGWSKDELLQSAATGVDLPMTSANACREAYERHAQKVAFNGDSARGLSGFFNHPNVPVANVPNGAGGNEEWNDKTAEEILFDVNDAINDVWTTTKQNELPDTLLLPLEAYSILVTKRLSTNDSETTLFEFLRTKTLYTAQTGEPLTIRACADLDTAGAGGEGRMMVYENDSEKVKFHIPEVLNFEEPQKKGLGVLVPGTYKLGGIQFTYPLSASYRDRVA